MCQMPLTGGVGRGYLACAGSFRQNGEHMDLKKLRAANTTRQQEWDKEGGITASYRAMELGGEVGEALNVVKKLERERLGIRGSRATKEQLAEELADVVICVDLIAMQYGIDLGDAVREKFNATSRKVGLSTLLEEPAPAESP
jgi:NTP pyrophosphatase (non-canonical NTP hydrolase)